jgi:hypothetical protein
LDVHIGLSWTNLFVIPVTLSHILLIIFYHFEDFLRDGLPGIRHVKVRDAASATHNLLLLCLVCQTIASESSRTLLLCIQSLFDPLDILQSQFGLDDLHIARWVDIALHVCDFGIIECSDDLEDTIYSANMGKEGVSESFTC